MNEDEDAQKAIDFIYNHELKTDIIAMYTTGPPENEGFMWCDNDTPAKKTMSNFVLGMGYDSSGYGMMQRRIQTTVRMKEKQKVAEVFCNEAALKVFELEGSTESAGGDYGTMRSMFG